MPERTNRPAWTAWYRMARDEAANRHGLRQVPVDVYRGVYLEWGHDTITSALNHLVRALRDAGIYDRCHRYS